MDVVPGTSDRKLTYSDYLGFPDDGLRHELIEGAHHVSPSPNPVHQRLSGRLFVGLYGYLQAHPIGEVFTAPLDVVLSNTDVLVPDLLIVLRDQGGILTDRHVQGAPALVVEILSQATRRRDSGLKRRVYERCGVPEYWTVDPVRECVTVYRRRDDGALADVHEIMRGPGQSVGSPLLPGFSLPLDDLFARAS